MLNSGSCRVVILIGLIAVGLTGCIGSPTMSPKPPVHTENDVSLYFPVTPGTTWRYSGEGNEYAAFTASAIRSEKTKVQFAQENGGTRLGLVYDVTPSTVTLVYAQEEFYGDGSLLGEPSNRKRLLLQGPLQYGAVWEDATERRQILAMEEIVTVPAGRFEVIKIKVTPRTGADWYAFEYYAQGIGLVKREYLSGDVKIVSQLTEVTRRP